MSDRFADDFERALAERMVAYSDEVPQPADPYSVTDRAAAPARRPQGGSLVALAAGAAVLLIALVIGLSFSAWRRDDVAGLPTDGPSSVASSTPSESYPATVEPTGPAATPSPTPVPCALVDCPDLPIMPGQFGETTSDTLVWAAPGQGDGMNVGLGPGLPVYVNDSRTVDGEGWYRIQFRLLVPPTEEYVLGWIPGSVDGASALRASEVYSSPFRCPDDPVSAWVVASMEPAARTICGTGLFPMTLTLRGYLGELVRRANPIFSGEPAWLANEPELIVWSAVGAAAEGMQIPVHLDPDSGVTITDDVLSRREGSPATVVQVTGHFGDEASQSCRRSPRIEGFLEMTDDDHIGWCNQQFVVDQVHVGEWIEPDLGDLDTCQNADAGYSLSFPDAWYSNTEYDGIAACQFFHPGSFVTRPGVPPTGVAISVRYVSDAGHPLAVPLWSEETTVAGRPAVRSEWDGVTEGRIGAPWFRTYEYLVHLGDDPTIGPYLRLATTNGAGDYDTNRDVLDAMTETLVLTAP